MHCRLSWGVGWGGMSVFWGHCLYGCMQGRAVFVTDYNFNHTGIYIKIKYYFGKIIKSLYCTKVEYLAAVSTVMLIVMLLK